jgi:ABC-type transport system substrate-binding protein
MSKRSYWDRLQRERLSRRRMLGVMGAGAAGLAVAAACGGGDDEDGEETPGAQDNATPQPGGTLLTGTTVTPTFGLDPHTDVALGLVIFPRMYGFLLHEDPRDGTIQLDHAEAQPEQTDTTYVIKITPGIQYQEGAQVPAELPPLPAGRTVTSEDVKASWDRYVANPLVTGTKTFFTDFVESIETPDELTVRINLTQPYVYAAETIGGILSGAIIPVEHTDVATVPNLNNGGVGSGPYMIQRASLDSEIEVVRNPNYFRTPLPYLDGRVWRIIRDASLLRAAFVGQEVDAYAPADKLEADEVEGQTQGGYEVIVERSPSLAYVSFSMNVEQAPFTDPRVREAISLAIDRDKLIENITFGDGEILGPINHHLRDGFWSLPTAEIETAYGMDLTREERLQRAQELLSAANAGTDEIVVKFPTLTNIQPGAESVQQDLQEIGLNIRLEPQELAVWFVGYRQGDFQATYQPHLPYEGPNIPSRFFYTKGVSGELNFHHYSNPEVDTLIERSWGEFDEATRQATLQDMQRLVLADHGPMLNLYTGVTRGAYWSYVHGLQLELPGSMQQYVYDEFMTRA